MVKPGCPHCMKKFKSWPEAKKHVKYCKKGPNARKPITKRNTYLNCAFCWQPCKDFAELSQHVRTECLGSPREREKSMNIGQYVNEGEGGRLPLLDAKLFKKLQKKGVVTAKMLACRVIKTANFHGLAMDFKDASMKFAFLARFDRWDITALAKQAGSEDTDDWIGETIRFILRKAKKGGGFVNVELPKRKGKK